LNYDELYEEIAMTPIRNDALLVFTLVITRVAWALLIVGAVAAFVAMGFIAFDLTQGSQALTSEYPDTDPAMLRSWLWLLLPLAACGFLLAAAFMRLLSGIIASVSQGDPFDAINTSRLYRMAWLALAFQLIAIPVRIVKDQVDQLTDGVSSGDFAVSITGLVFVLTLFVLAHVFAHGAAMRDDLEGTV
jgi:DUF2975 family protein